MTKKILCVCDHGNVRSGALRYLIWRKNKGNYKDLKYEAIATGVMSTSIETLASLADWADIVVDLSSNNEGSQKTLKEISGDKYIRKDIGPDIWHNPQNPDLHNKLWKFVEKHL